MYRKLGLRIAALGLPLLLAACGDTTEDRALSGAGIGAASGAVIGAVTGIGPGDRGCCDGFEPSQSRQARVARLVRRPDCFRLRRGNRAQYPSGLAAAWL
jgi:hypothetical protein